MKESIDIPDWIRHLCRHVIKRQLALAIWWIDTFALEKESEYQVDNIAIRKQELEKRK